MDTNNGAMGKYLMPVAVLVGLVFIGGAVLWNGSHPAGTTGTTTGKNGFGNEASIQKLTKTISGIDAAKVAAAVKANGTKYAAAVDADRTEAQKFNINATPSFVVGTEMLAGAQPYSVFQTSIEAALKKGNVPTTLNLTGEPSLGAANAPVTIGFWSDFQCPYCKAVEVGHPQIQVAPSVPEIIKNYVDTGKVKLVFKDFSFLGPDSNTAAVYARAVWELYPDKYFEWRTAMYQAQDGENDSQ